VSIKRAGCAAFLIGWAALVAVQHAQSPQNRPQFRAGVEYVEVDARVVDAKGEPIRALTQRDFKVLEDGVSQDLRTFSAVDLSSPSGSGPAIASAGIKPDVATNVSTSLRGRTYLIVLDTLFIGRTRTVVVRRFLRDFIERSIGPDDLVGFATTGLDSAYENFTNDKPRLIAAVERLVGQGGSPTVGGPITGGLTDLATRSALTAPGRNAPNIPVASGTMDAPLRSQRQITQLVQAMGGAGGGSKAIILVSESIPFETVTNTEGLTLLGDAERMSTAARHGNVPIYPVDPRGLSSGSDDAIEVGLLGLGDHPEVSLQAETRRGQERLRALADDTGGVPIIGNGIAGGLDRVVTLSSHYYVLGYNSTNSRRDGRYHRIEITVDRPGARVLARRGYTATRPADAKNPALAGPPGSSLELRQALNAILPVADLPLSATAAAFRGAKGNASVAVVLESLGSELAWGPNDTLQTPIELTAVAIDPRRGGILSGDVDRVQFPTRTDTSDRVKQFGFRWLARLTDVKPGHYQIRVVAANGLGKQGSAWYELEIPDFSKTPLAMSDVLLASVVAMQRPTLRPDGLLKDALPGPATTLRDFLAVDMLAVYAEVYDNDLSRPHDVETTVVITNDQGEEKARTGERHTSRQAADSRGVVRVQAKLPLGTLAPGRYTLSVEARQTQNAATLVGRAVPFRIVARQGIASDR
jgi:VWFA-related protein